MTRKEWKKKPVLHQLVARNWWNRRTLLKLLLRARVLSVFVSRDINEKRVRFLHFSSDCISSHFLGDKCNLQKSVILFPYIVFGGGRNLISYSCSHAFFRNADRMDCFQKSVSSFFFKDGNGWGCIVLLQRKKWSSSLDGPSLQLRIRWIDSGGNICNILRPVWVVILLL